MVIQMVIQIIQSIQVLFVCGSIWDCRRSGICIVFERATAIRSSGRDSE